MKLDFMVELQQAHSFRYANLRNLENPGRLAGQTILWFAITALASVLIGLAVGCIGLDQISGQGRYTIELSHYEAVPPNVQTQLVGQHKVQDEE